MKILVFTDSRGEHKKTFESQNLFTEKLKIRYDARGHQVTLMLCPYSWTTTLDFIDCINSKIIDINQYDLVILYTGIVDASPRPLSNFNNVYDNKQDDIVTYSKLVSRDRSIKRIINNKKKFMDKFVPQEFLKRHLTKDYDINYSGEKTKSFVSLEIYEKVVLPFLKKYDSKIVFINSNRVVPGWEGNYLSVNKEGRPKNISIIERYSELAKARLSNVVDLLKWTNDEVKKYTVDNMHLTFLGSEYIYSRLCEFIDKRIKQ